MRDQDCGGDLGIKAEGMEYEAITSGSLKIRGKVLGCSWERSQRGFKLLGAPIREQIGDPSFAFPYCVDYEEREDEFVFLLVQRSNRGVGEHNDFFEGLVLKRGWRTIGAPEWDMHGGIVARRISSRHSCQDSPRRP
jgi:hypothetical protein